MSRPVYPTESRLILPDAVWLEPEQFAWSSRMSETARTEGKQWQSYLNALALQGLEHWFRDRLPQAVIEPDTGYLESVGYLTVNGFRVCVITTEHLLDEVVPIPCFVLDKAELGAHFYVAIEVSEEQEELIIRGVLRPDQFPSDEWMRSVNEECYQFPLAWFDAELHHWLVYCRVSHLDRLISTNSGQ
ncbi:DUF1822 family protein [Pseudanabaenaceae cyanobacterium LEGE 13415]|nr:DUF1822 family protein [Pseudanabaenaceae cyanobacterium LEGE 13415]